MSITKLSVKYSQFTFIVTACIVMLGALSFRAIPRLEDPAYNVPAFIVVAFNPGGSSVDIEQLVARPLENAFKELDEVDKIRTTVKDGFAFISVEFDFGADVEKKYDALIRQVNVTRPRLPDGVVGVEVRKIRTINVSTLWVALVSPDASYGRMEDLAEKLRKSFEGVAGVRVADKHAIPLKQVRVTLDLDKIAALHLPIGQIIQAVQADNITIPGGAVETGSRRFNLNTSDRYQTLDDVRRTPVSGSGEAVVHLGDISNVEWTNVDHEEIARFNGQRAVFVSAKPQPQQNLFAISENLREKLKEFNATLPGDVKTEIVWDQTGNIGHRIGGLQRDFILAFALVLLTVLPLGFRASVLVMLSIPLSFAMGIGALYYTGFSMNQLSIVGCVIALGLLVDDSIVVVENIARYRREGKGPFEAAVMGTNQIAVAVIGTTMVLLFAFLPLLTLPGGPGQFIRSLPVAVVYTVLASMIVALTIVPLLASMLLKGDGDEHGNILLHWLQHGITTAYRPILHWCMYNPRMTLVGAALFTAASFCLVPQIGFSLFPKAGIPQFMVQIEAEEGASVAATDSIAKQVEAILTKHSDQIASYATTVGNLNPQVYYNEIQSAPKANVAEVVVTLKHFEPKESPEFIAKLHAECEKISGARIVVREYQQGPLVEAPIAVRIFDDNLTELAQLGAQVDELLRSIEGTQAVNNPLRVRRTELRVVINRPVAAMLGVPAAEIDRAVRLAFAGLDVSRFRIADGDEYPIQIALPRGDRATLDNWPKIQVQTASGAYVPISQVAELKFESVPPLIQRFNRVRSVTVTSFVREGYNTNHLTSLAEDKLNQVKWPAGVRWEFGGEVESRKESFGGLGNAVFIAGFGILAILILEFRNHRGALIVASVIPLGIVGGLIGLWITNNSLSFMAAIGFVALVGIEIKNSILLVDFTNQLRSQGVELREAIEQAGETRFLPVVLTTLTAIGALLPLALEGSGLYSPLAIVIMGGLVSSLVLSRLVTPVLYSLMPPPPPDKED